MTENYSLLWNPTIAGYVLFQLPTNRSGRESDSVLINSVQMCQCSLSHICIFYKQSCQQVRAVSARALCNLLPVECSDWNSIAGQWGCWRSKFHDLWVHVCSVRDLQLVLETVSCSPYICDQRRTKQSPSPRDVETYCVFCQSSQNKAVPSRSGGLGKQEADVCGRSVCCDS